MAEVNSWKLLTIALEGLSGQVPKVIQLISFFNLFSQGSFITYESILSRALLEFYTESQMSVVEK